MSSTAPNLDNITPHDLDAIKQRAHLLFERDEFTTTVELFEHGLYLADLYASQHGNKLPSGSGPLKVQLKPNQMYAEDFRRVKA